MSGLFEFPKRKLRKLAKAGDYKEAIDYGLSIEKKFRDDGDYYFIMGSIYYIVEDARNAQACLDRALDLNEFDTEAMLLLANIDAHDRPRDAIKRLKRLLEIDPEHREAADLLLKLQDNQ